MRRVFRGVAWPKAFCLFCNALRSSTVWVTNPKGILRSSDPPGNFLEAETWRIPLTQITSSRTNSTKTSIALLEN